MKPSKSMSGYRFLSSREKRIVDVLKKDNDQDLMCICLASSMSVSRVSEVLLGLSQKGIVSELPGGLYHLTEENGL